MRLAWIGIGIVLLAACREPVVVLTDACTRSDNANHLVLDFDVTVSGDSAFVVSWTPASCQLSAIEVFRYPYVGSCSGGTLPICAAPSYLWRVATPFVSLPGDGPATIAGPVIYGSAIAGTTVVVPPAGLTVGDSVNVTLARATTDPRFGPQNIGFVVEVGTARSVPAPSRRQRLN